MKTYTFTIDGKAVSATESFEIRNPATGEVLGQAPVSTEEQVNDAVASAKAAQKAWAALADDERKATLMKMAWEMRYSQSKAG